MSMQPIKITVKGFFLNRDEPFVISLEPNANIRQLRDKLAAEFKQKWEDIEIVGMEDKNGNKGSIYIDDPSEETLVNSFRKEAQNPELAVNELTIRVRPRGLGVYQHRRTEYNPLGYVVGAGLVSEPGNKFFRDAADPSKAIPFSKRLEDIKFDMDTVPEHLLDPVTKEIMENPVITSSQRTFDLKVLERMNYIDPFTKQKVTVLKQNLLVRAELEKFVSQQEANAAKAKAGKGKPESSSDKKDEAEGPGAGAPGGPAFTKPKKP